MFSLGRFRAIAFQCCAIGLTIAVSNKKSTLLFFSFHDQISGIVSVQFLSCDRLVDLSEINYSPYEFKYRRGQFSERRKWSHWQNFDCQKEPIYFPSLSLLK